MKKYPNAIPMKNKVLNCKEIYYNESMFTCDRS